MVQTQLSVTTTLHMDTSSLAQPCYHATTKISTTNTFRLCALGVIDVKDIEDFFVVFGEALSYFNVRTR